jgi:Arc/MetJ-type ribon-helix-helix transcriptional regulator
MPRPQKKQKDIPEAFSRRTITIPPDLEAAIDALVGRGKFSAFAQQAFAHELQRETIAQWLDERDASRNGRPLSAEAVQFAERAWRNRK